MRQDPALCPHHEIGKSAKIETLSVPELGIEQLVLRIKVFCRACKEPFVIKTLSDGFSTSEIGLVGDELLVPLEKPYREETDESDMERHPLDCSAGPPRAAKEQLH